MQSGSAGSLFGGNVDIFPIGNASEANEAQALDFLIDGQDDDDFITGTRTNTGGAEQVSFQSSAEYILLKFGQNSVFLSLSGYGPVDIEFDGTRFQGGGGLSHYTEFGQLAVVPLPAAGLMLMAGLGGIGALRRRKMSA